MKRTIFLSLAIFIASSPFVKAMQLEQEKPFSYANENADFKQAGRNLAMSLLQATVLKAEGIITELPPTLIPAKPLLDPALAEREGISFTNTALFYQGLYSELCRLTPEKIVHLFPAKDCAIAQWELLLYLCQALSSVQSYEEWAAFDVAIFWKNRMERMVSLLKGVSDQTLQEDETTFPCNRLLVSACEAKDFARFIDCVRMVENHLDRGNVTQNELTTMQAQMFELLESTRERDFLGTSDAKLSCFETLERVGWKYTGLLTGNLAIFEEKVFKSYFDTYKVGLIDVLKVIAQDFLECFSYDMQSNRDDLYLLAQSISALTRIEKFLETLTKLVSLRPDSCGARWIFKKIKRDLRVRLMIHSAKNGAVTIKKHSNKDEPQIDEPVDTSEETLTLERIQEHYGIFPKGD